MTIGLLRRARPDRLRPVPRLLRKVLPPYDRATVPKCSDPIIFDHWHHSYRKVPYSSGHKVFGGLEKPIWGKVNRILRLQPSLLLQYTNPFNMKQCMGDPSYEYTVPTKYIKKVPIVLESRVSCAANLVA